MDLNVLKWEAMELACEDSYGLWEILWQLHTKFPEVPTEAWLAPAREAIRDLIAHGWLSLWRLGSASSTDEEPVADADVQDLLAEPANWCEPEGDSIAIRFFATPEGMRAHRSRDSGRPGDGS